MLSLTASREPCSSEGGYEQKSPVHTDFCLKTGSTGERRVALGHSPTRSFGQYSPRRLMSLHYWLGPEVVFL